MNNTIESETMAKKRTIMAFEMNPQTLKQLRAIAKTRERSAGFAIRKAIDFWLANGAPEIIEKPKAEAKKL